MRKIVIIILVLTIGKLQAQTLKTFSGDLDNGKVTFSYYDDPTTGKEVRHGEYKYIETDNGENGSKFSLTITGVYKNGYRDGIWNYTINKIDCSSENNNEFYTGNTTMKQSYKDGMPDGIWSYLNSYKVRNQKYSRVGWSWGPFKIVEPEVITANFCNGVLCGNLLIKTTYEKVVGQLDNSGRWIGNWNINSKNEMMLEKGYVMNYKLRDDNGQVSSQSNFNPEMIRLINQIKDMPAQEVTKYCVQNHLKMDTIYGSKHYNLDCFNGNGQQFKYQTTDGDKTYIADEYGNHYDKRQYGYFISIERIKMKKLSEIPAYSEALQGSTNLNSVYEEYNSVLSEEDKTILLQKIENEKKKEQLLSNIKNIRDSISNMNFKIQDAVKNPYGSTTSNDDKDWLILSRYSKLWSSYLDMKSQYYKSSYKLKEDLSLLELNEFHAFQKNLYAEILKVPIN